MDPKIADHLANARDALAGVEPTARGSEYEDAFRQLFYAVDSLTDAVERLASAR